MEKHYFKYSYSSFLKFESLEEIVAHFNLGTLIHNPSDVSSTSNNTIVIHTNNKKYILKSYGKSRENPEQFAFTVQRELQFCRFLFEKGFPVPQNLTVQPFIFNGMLTIITEYIDGEFVNENDLSDQFYIKLGELVANFHLNSEAYGTAGMPQEQRNSYWKELNKQRHAIELHIDRDLTPIMEYLEQYQKIRQDYTKLFGQLPSGLVHSEFAPGHLIKSIEPDRGLVLFDFDGIRFSPYIFDFGQLAMNFFIPKNYFDVVSFKKVISAYNAIRKLSLEEQSLIPKMLEYNFLHKTEWILLASLSFDYYVTRIQTIIDSYDSIIASIREVKFAFTEK